MVNSVNQKFDALTWETLFLGIQTKLLMRYILTGDKNLKKAIDIGSLAWAITKAYK